MGVFENVFDILDPACKGFLTATEVQQYDEALHYSPLCLQHIEASIRQLCGSASEGCVTRSTLLIVLQDLERRRSLEEQLRWDFLSLDQSGTAQLPLKQVLLLFTMVHGDNFAMQTWQTFLSSRGENKDEDVFFDEIKILLCGYPEGTPASSKDIAQEQRRLANLKQEQTNKDVFRCIKTKEFDDLQTTRDKQDYENSTRKLARRKLNTWETDGVEGLIYDDGLDHGEEVSAAARGHIGIAEVTDALQVKYDLLRKKLFWDMLKRNIGENAFNLLDDTEKLEHFQQLHMQEAQMRDEGFLDTQAIDLVGAQVPHTYKLYYYMGELKDIHDKRKNDMYTQRLELRAKRKSDAEVDKILREEHDKEFKGPVTSADMLIELDTRYLQEKQWIIGKLRSDTVNKWSNKMLLTEYFSMIREHMLADLEGDFYSACAAVGLTEREQEYKPEKYDPDRLRQEYLARSRLSSHQHRQRSKFPYEDPEYYRERTKSSVEMKLDIVKEIVWKHVMERETLVEYLLGPESGQVKQTMSKMSEEQRTKYLTSLRNQRNKWREYNQGYRTSQRETHIKILLEGTAIYYENCRQEQIKLFGKKEATDASVCASLLADLQEKQDIEFYSLMQQIQSKSDVQDLLTVKTEEKQARREEVYDNIASVVLGTEKWTDEEIPFMEAVEAKYFELRRLLLSHVLELEHGVTWHRLPERDRLRLMERKTSEEEKLRNAGQFENMANLIQRMPKDTGSLRALMGEDRGEYSRRIKTLNEFKEQSAVTGQQLDSSLLDEKPASNINPKPVNLLADMVNRARLEEDAVVGYMRNRSDLSLQERLVPLVQLKIEKRRALKQEQFGAAALSIGLMERITSFTDEGFCQKTDHVRQLKLAFVRVEGRRRRVEAGRLYSYEETESPPEAGDTLGMMEAYIRERDKKHTEEREILLNILQDPGFEDLFEAAKTINDHEKHKRLAELQAKRRRMNMHNKDNQDENISILEEAAAIRFVMKKMSLEKEHKRDFTKDEISAYLLAEVQDEQDKEMGGAISRLGKMELDDLEMARTLEIELRQWRAAENVVYVLTQYEGSAEDKQILTALEEKYNALREQVLQNILNQDDNYNKLTGPEKHRKLVHMTIQEKKSRKEGNFGEITRLLGGLKLQNEGSFLEQLGETRVEYEKRLKRMLGGIPSAAEEEEYKTSGSVFEMLQERYEHEKKFLLDAIRGTSGVIILEEKQREVMIVRLHYEKSTVSEQTQLMAATLSVGLAERQQPDIVRRNPTDRWRQEKLADLMFDSLSTTKYKEKNDIVKQGDGTVLKEAVIQHLQDKHHQESVMLFEFILHSKAKSDVTELAQNISEIQRQNRLKELKEKRAQISVEKTKDQHTILAEAAVYKKISRALTLKHKATDDSIDVKDSDIAISILADLQERQHMETEHYLQKLAHNTDNDVIQMQSTIVNEKKCHAVNNVAEVLLNSEESKEAGDHELIQALENKYDTLRDKLLSEALLAQLGENEWQRMSERDRQKKLVEMRLKEKKLRKEGRVEEANKLIGDLVTDSENLRMLLATNREEYERKLAEKRAKRLMRINEGFTDEEVDQLEAEEAAEEKKKGANVLQDLDACFEKEKEALLKSLSRYKEGVESDKLRQLELARLKQDQRRAQEEDKFSAAALYISMANEQKEKLEDHRQRQEDLAKQRLAEKIKKRKEKKALQESEVPMPENQSDVLGWIEAITKEIELKHSEERDIMIQFLNDSTVQGQRQQAKDMDQEAKNIRLEELRLLRDDWKDGGCIGSSEHMNILKEAANITLEMLPEPVTDENVALLANLQEQQDQDMTRLTDHLIDKSSQSLKQIKTSQEIARKQQWYDNVAVVILKVNGKAQRVGQNGPGLKEVLDALERKYDTLMDKLMEKALRQQLGDEKWNQLSTTDQKSRIVKLKLQNRQLRHQGKYQEANELFGELIFDTDLSSKLGDSRSHQRKIKEERLQMKRQLIAERKEQGLSISDTVLEALLDEIEKKKEQSHKKNILDQLQEHFDDEKELVTSSITNCDSGEDADILIQLELARLLRERKQLAQEEEFSASIALLNIIDQRERHKDSNQPSDLDRQRAVALGRLNARMKNYTKLSALEQLQRDESERQADQAKLVDILESQDLASVHASVLSEVELRQEREREELIDLLYESTHSQPTLNWVSKFTPEDRKFELEKARQERTKWKTRCLQSLAENMESNKDTSNLTQDEVTELVKMREEQHELLLKAVACRLHMEMEEVEISHPHLTQVQMVEMIGAKLLVDLQQKQLLDYNAVSKVANEKAKDEFRLKQLLDTQMSSTREGWMDNLTNIIFTMTSVEDSEEDNQDVDMSSNESQITDALEEELRQEKDNLITKLTSEGKSQEYILSQVKNLEKEHDERRESLMAVIEKQKMQQKNKQIGKKQSEANREYEDDIAMQMAKMANREMSFIQKLNPKFLEKDKMSEKIQERREARRREAMLVTPPDASERKRSRSLPHGGLGMKREKTVIDVPLTDDQISEKQKQLMRDVAARNRQIAMEQRIHEDRLQKRLQAMKDKRHHGVQEVFSTMERQRSELQAVQQDERARQLQRTKEDLQRRREQQNQDMKARSSKSTSQFQDLQSKISGDSIREVDDEADNDSLKNSEHSDDPPVEMKAPHLQLVTKEGINYTTDDPLLEQSNLAAKRVVKPDSTQYDIV